MDAMSLSLHRVPEWTEITRPGFELGGQTSPVGLRMIAQMGIGIVSPHRPQIEEPSS